MSYDRGESHSAFSFNNEERCLSKHTKKQGAANLIGIHGLQFFKIAAFLLAHHRIVPYDLISLSYQTVSPYSFFKKITEEKHLSTFRGTLFKLD